MYPDIYAPVECQMLIRKPVENVFTALIDPAVTTRFWSSKSSELNLVKDRFPDLK